MVRADPNLLADHLVQQRRVAIDVSWVVAFTLLTALMAQIRFQFPFTPVPLTGQTFAVLLSGAVLGSRRGFASQLLYLAAGVSGLPVFAGAVSSPASLFAPTGGYLISFPIAAFFIGWLVERGASQSAWKLALSLMFCDSLILLIGAEWLHSFFGIPFRRAALLGFYPFLIGDMLKIVLVGMTLPRLIKRVDQTNPV